MILPKDVEIKRKF